MRIGHARAVLEIEPAQTADLDLCAAGREALTIVFGVVEHQVFAQGLEAHLSEVRQPDAEVAVCRAGQRFVESTCLQQGPKSNEEVGTLDVRVVGEEVSSVEPGPAV